MGGLVSLGDAPVQRSTEIATVEAREAQMIQGMIVSARKFPRDEQAAFTAIMRSCERPTLAEEAIYAYPRGGQTVSGPSIRLAEVLKQSWGNMRSGWREVERMVGGSKCYAYAWDIQTNAIQDVEFYIPHIRDTRSGGKQLTDERDIYEMNANMSKRRERACILSVIPGDIVEAAVDKCEATMSKATDLAKAIPEMLKAFSTFAVTPEQIEARIRKKVTSIGQSEFAQLRKIYTSLKDGASTPGDWFEAQHDPEKIKRESASSEAAPPTSVDKNEAARAKSEAWVAFQNAAASVTERGGSTERVLNKTIAEISKADTKSILAAVDILEAWGAS